MKAVLMMVLGLIPSFFLNVHAQNTFLRVPNQQDGLEKLLNECYYSHLWSEQNNDVTGPSFQFEVYIDRTTTLVDLAKMQRRVRRHLGVTLTYRDIEFDSAGLSGISVEAKSKYGVCMIYRFKIADFSDYGIFEVSYRGLRRWYVGRKSRWPEYFQVSLTSR